MKNHRKHHNVKVLIQMITGYVLTAKKVSLKTDRFSGRRLKYTAWQLRITGWSRCLVSRCGHITGSLAGVDSDGWQTWTHISTYNISRGDLMPQHVSGKVCFLCIRLTTQRADLGLQMFCLAMLRDVIAQCCLVAEALVAGAAAERPVGHVTALVTLQVWQLWECLAAAWVLANVRLVSRMCPLMLL